MTTATAAFDSERLRLSVAEHNSLLDAIARLDRPHSEEWPQSSLILSPDASQVGRRFCRPSLGWTTSSLGWKSMTLSMAPKIFLHLSDY